jgi:hypothetical protein
MPMPFMLAIVLAGPVALRDPALAARIPQLLHTMLTSDDESDQAAVEAEAKRILAERGLATIADVGDEAAYEFVVLTCSPGPALQARVLALARQALARHQLARDAVLYCEARARQQAVKDRAKAHPPTHPALRDEIQRLLVTDQAARQVKDFDVAKMAEVDRAHAGALDSIVEKYGAPTYTMVGPEAASSFVTMVQHQPPDFRRRVLPRLKANVEAGQADPGDYAMVYDRSAGDAGRKQLYGQNLVCTGESPTWRPAPIEDEGAVDIRRARIGLMRLELYVRTVVELSPAMCAAAATPK